MENSPLFRAILSGGGEMGKRVREYDWSTTSLGAIETWPQCLLTAATLVISSAHPLILFWSKELISIYNDAYIPIFGARHPKALGKPAHIAWLSFFQKLSSKLNQILNRSETWDVIGPMIDIVLKKGEATWSTDKLLLLTRNNYLEECYFTWSYSPVRDEKGNVAGVLTPINETTSRVLNERRLKLVRELGTMAMSGNLTVKQTFEKMEIVFNQNPTDITFVLFYFFEPEDEAMNLSFFAGFKSGQVNTHATNKVKVNQNYESKSLEYELLRSFKGNSPVLVEDLETRFGYFPGRGKIFLYFPIN